MNRMSITLGEDLYNIIKERAKSNFRSMNSEILCLIEAGIDADMDLKENLLRELLSEVSTPKT